MPIGVAGAVSLGAAALGAGASLYASGQQSDAISSAQKSANAQQAAALAQSTALQAPYNAAGNASVQQQQNLLGLNGTDSATSAMGQFKASPGYQYQLQQGLSAVDNGAAASGLLRSGATLRAEQTLGDNLASQDFGNYYNRLAGLTSVGQNAASGVGNQGIQTAAGIASTDTSGASALSSIYGNTASGIGSAVNNAAKNYLSTPQMPIEVSGGGTSGYGTGFLGGNSSGANTLQSMGFYNPLPTN